MPSSNKNPHPTLNHFEDLFLAIGVPEKDLPRVIPSTVEEAITLAKDLDQQSWFKPGENICLGHVFQITSAMMDMRAEANDNWSLTCAMVDHMPKAISTKSPAAEEIYGSILLNMTAVRHGTEDSSPEGAEKGYKILTNKK